MSERREGSESLYAELDGAKADEATAEEDLQESKKALAKSTRLLQNAEKDLATKEKLMTKLYPKLTTAQERSKQTRKRIADLEAGEKRLGKDISAQEEYVAGLRSDMAALEDAEKSLKAELSRIASRTSGGKGGSLQLDAGMMAEYTRIRAEVAARTSKEKTEETNLEREAVSKQNRIEDLRVQEAAIRKEIESTRAQISDYEDRSRRIGLLIEENRSEMKQSEAQREALAQEAAATQESITSLTSSIESLSERLKEAGEDRVRGKREQAMADAVESMMRIFSGVHGRLVDLCKPIQKKYSTAIATASGKHMEAIVVDTKQAAAECIRYLKDQRVGTCMFLPLDNITSKPIPDRLRGLGQKYRLAVDLVESEDLFKPAVAYALGSTVVCDTLEEAQHLRFQVGEHVKVVTLNGHVITKAGTMTGGSTGREGRDRWEDREVDELKKQKAAAEDALFQLKRNVPSRQAMVDLEIKIKSLQTRIQFSEADSTVCTEKLAQLHQLRDLKIASLDKIVAEIATNEASVTKIQRTLSQLKATIGAVETEEFREFSARLGIDNICEYEQNVLKAHQTVLVKSGAIAEQKAALSAQLEYELKRDFKSARDKQLAQIAAAKQELEVTEAELKALSKEEDEIRASIRACSEAISKLKTSKNADFERSKELQKLRSDAAAARDAIGRKISAEEIEVERMRSQLHEMLQKAMVDEIALPTINVDRRASTGTARGRSSRGQSSVSSGDVEVDLDLEWAGTNTQRRSSGRFGRAEEPSASDTSESAHFSQSDNPVVLRDSNAVSLVDLSSLSTGPHKSALHNKQQQADLIASLNKKISTLSAELRTMQPNMHAAERFEGINDKLKECNENLDQVRDSSKLVSERFEEVKSLRHKLFMDCFEHVSEALTVIYKDLTKSSKHPLGGNAYLTLDNNEEPFLGGIRYTAMPPMKRYRYKY
jgi:structural maintenance of chromosome 1